ncbi:MAG: reductive dehalogenase domain-containing protein [Lutispora sp.]|nr:reductive dehalogenase domain-containing protein [Lutispora sp.]MDD4834420.1 reductive dehalogenase domain-containing protein [Lutispora sp.]
MEERKENRKAIEDYIRKQGGDLAGFASAAKYTEIFDIKDGSEHPDFYINNAKTIIVIGLKIVDSIMDNLKGEKDPYSHNLKNYLLHYAYDKLDEITAGASRFIEELGYDAYPIQARSEIRENGYLWSYFSHKKAAIAAGLGHVGKNSIIITTKYGTRVRLATIITDMDIETDTARDKTPGKVCGSCRVCIDACPVKALDFDEKNKYSIIDPVKCQNHMDYCQCALCQGICPIGKKIAEKQRNREKRFD